MRNTVRGITKQTNDIVSNARKEYVNNAEDFSEKFRDQNRSHNENMSIIRDQYNKLQAIYKKKMDVFNEKLNDQNTKLDKFSEKRRLDLEGFHSDLQNLEKRMTFYQNYIGKLKKLVDRDQHVNLGNDLYEDVILEKIREEEE